MFNEYDIPLYRLPQDATRVAPRPAIAPSPHTMSAYKHPQDGGLIPALRARFGLSNLPQESGLMGKLAELVGLTDPLSAIEGPARAAAVVARAGKSKNVLAGTKVVDKAGVPKRVFHGTPAAFENFDPKKLDNDALYGPGFYWTEDAATAGGDGVTVAGYSQKGAVPQGPEYQPAAIRARMAEREQKMKIPSISADGLKKLQAYQRNDVEILNALESGGGPNVRPARLAMKNPFDINRVYSHDEVADIYARGGLPEEAERYREIHGNVRGSEPTGQRLWDSIVEMAGGDKGVANAMLKDAGFDGITHIGGSNTGNKPHRVWITFDRSQIRSPWGDAKTAVQFGALGGLMTSPLWMAPNEQ
jgi:hypothetical protein